MRGAEKGDLRPVIFVGTAAYDAIAAVERMPRSDERLIATDLVYRGGGPAATAAVAAHRLGLEVSLIAAIGDDPVGELVLADLEAEGIAVDQIQVEPSRRSQASVILCTADDDTRSIVTHGVAPLRLDERNRTAVREADWVHVDHLGWPAVAEALAGLSRDTRPRISVDAGHAVVGSAAACHLEDVELYAPPMSRLIEQFGDASHEELLRKAPSRSVVATLGAGGSVGRDALGRIVSSQGFRAPVLASTLGAGDVYHGALTAAIVREQPLSDALTYANAAAALSCRALDGRSGIPSHSETLAFIGKERS